MRKIATLFCQFIAGYEAIWNHLSKCIDVLAAPKLKPYYLDLCQPYNLKVLLWTFALLRLGVSTTLWFLLADSQKLGFSTLICICGTSFWFSKDVLTGQLNQNSFKKWAPLMVVYFCVQLTDKSKYKNEWYLGNIAFLSSQLMPLKLMGLFVQCLLFWVSNL